MVTVVIQQYGTRHGVYTRIVIYHKASIIVHLGSVEVIALGELLQSATIEVYAIEVFVIWILVGILTISGEVNHTRLLVHLQDFLHMPRAFGDAIL